MRRRDFLCLTASGGFIGNCGPKPLDIPGLRLTPAGFLGGARREEGRAPLAGASWYVAAAEKDGVTFTFPPGALARAVALTADFLLDGRNLAIWSITLGEGETGRRFRFRFGGLAQCGFRVRLPLSLTDQNRWGIDREGAFLKPRVSGDRVDLDKVDRMELTIQRKAPEPVRWSMTDFIAAESDVPLMTDPLLPQGPLLDELGQSMLHQWPARSTGIDEVAARIRAQHAAAASQQWPQEFSKWGGWTGRRLTKGAGFFRTHHDGRRWWLVDPDGYAFWSAGLDCVRVDAEGFYDLIEKALSWLPEGDPAYKDIFGNRTAADGRTMRSIYYLAANMIRALGPDGWRPKWAAIALAEMRRLRFNTVGNWSEWEFAKQAQFPYVRPMSFQGRRVKMIYRDFPDVFDAGFGQDAAEYASQLESTRDDPAFLGYFLMNEPTWGFSSELPAAGMLYVTAECATRRALADWLRRKYKDDAALAAAWKMDATLERVAGGLWTGRILTPEAMADLRLFSVQMAERYFNGLSDACKKADPNHLNLGMRWAGVPPEWAVEGMKSFHVFSMNCYQDRVPRDVTGRIQGLLRMPVIIGEWHFGALDAGLPASGIGHLKNQADRGRAYRAYLEDAAANPDCVGAHWFTLYDQSAIGRFDGENYNIGFLDICNRPYDEMSAAAIASHERLYEVAAGSVEAFGDVPQYLPKLY